MSLEATVFCFAMFGLVVFARFLYREYRFIRRRHEWREDMRQRYEREKWEQ